MMKGDKFTLEHLSLETTTSSKFTLRRFDIILKTSSLEKVAEHYNPKVYKAVLDALVDFKEIITISKKIQKNPTKKENQYNIVIKACDTLLQKAHLDFSEEKTIKKTKQQHELHLKNLNQVELDSIKGSIININEAYQDKNLHLLTAKDIDNALHSA